jgi:hypothetical protein
MILVSSLLLAAAQPTNPAQDAASSQAPATQDAAPASQGVTRRPRTTSPPGSTPMPPMPNVDRGIQLPPGKAPEKPAPGEPAAPAPDSASPRDESVKPVPPAPSKPGQPGVRPLG